MRAAADIKNSQLWNIAAETSSRRRSNKLEKHEKHTLEEIAVDVLVIRPLDCLDAV